MIQGCDWMRPFGSAPALSNASIDFEVGRTSAAPCSAAAGSGCAAATGVLIVAQSGVDARCPSMAMFGLAPFSMSIIGESN